MKFRYVHAADLHLDTPFTGIEPLPEPLASEVRDASLDAFDALVALTIDQEAAFLLLAGDIYDGLQRGIRAQLRFREGMELLAEKGISVFLIRGEHDPEPDTVEDWPAVRVWPDNVTFLRDEGLQSIPIEHQGHRIATLHHAVWFQDPDQDDLFRCSESSSEGGLQIALLYQEVTLEGSSRNPDAWTPAQMEKTGIHYWALGRNHVYQELLKKTPWTVYPGTTQGRGIRIAERGPKGAVVVEADGMGIESVTFHALDRVRCVELILDTADYPDFATLKKALAEEGHALRERHNGRGLLVRARLQGSGISGQTLLQREVREAVRRNLRSDFEGLTPFFWWESLDKEYPESGDLQAMQNKGGLSASILRESETMAERLPDLESYLNRAFEPIAGTLAKIKAGSLAPAGGARRVFALLADAENRLLEQLERETES
ncbi:MAG: DNA repair exonuclease [Planctomycetes bacterium]|nr:DNA repair exonuclease [Planctomycetota bacterium]